MEGTKSKNRKKILGLTTKLTKMSILHQIKTVTQQSVGAESSFPAINRGSVVQSADWSAMVRGSSVIGRVTKNTPPSIVYVPIPNSNSCFFVKRQNITSNKSRSTLQRETSDHSTEATHRAKLASRAMWFLQVNPSRISWICCSYG